ncbi:hypothetical protein [Fluviicola taffensis]|uniref:hypothetical protein n=1 Tax=Fluviicola taffensis TaxID=191579 RepID=UPI003137A7BD
MSQYEADKVIALLQFCCWSSRVEMNHPGLLSLRAKLVARCEEINAFEKADKGPKAKELKPPNEKYLVDLLSEANKASKNDNKLSKSKLHIELLLGCGGFDSWKTWEDYFFNANEFISSGNLDLSGFSAIEIGISFPSILEKDLLPHLAFARKTSVYPIHLCSSNEESISEHLTHTMNLLKEYPFVIWAIPVLWNNQLEILDNPLWKEMLQSRRVLPVWIDESNVWEIQTSKIPWLKNHQTIGGLRGLFCGLLYIYEAIKKVHDGGTSLLQQASDEVRNSRTQNFQGSRGTFFLGDIKITSANTSLGDIHQTIHNNNTKKDDTNK